MKEIQKILLPVDFSDASPVLLRYGDHFARKHNARLVITFVAEDPFTYSGLSADVDIDPFDKGIEHSARQTMVSFLHEHKDALSVSPETVILEGHPAEEIISYADKEEFDLIIIGTHGYKGLERALFGSVAETVVKMAPCPVLTVNTFTGD